MMDDVFELVTPDDDGQYDVLMLKVEQELNMNANRVIIQFM
jgi:hypothetical protein